MSNQPLNNDQPSARRKPLMLALGGIFALAAVAYGFYYVNVLSQREETEDAYVGGNVINVTPQVSGTIIAIHGDETQKVEAGQDLIKLDATDSEVGLRQAEARLGEVVRSVRQQYASVGQYESLLAQRKVDLAKAQADYDRRAPLLNDKAISAEEVAHAKESLESARQAVKVVEQQLAASKAGLDGVTVLDHPSVLKARSDFEQAWLVRNRNAIVSPITGYVAKRTAQVGQRIAPGNTLMTIVPLDNLWVDANFKESELRNIRIGQPAKITADIWGNKVEYHGKVAGIAAGSGSAFSLLPAQNASGNWIKVVQRVPVRIALDPKELATHPLRVGLSTVVEVDTHKRDGETLAQVANTAPVQVTTAYKNRLDEVAKIADKIVAHHAGVSTAAVRAAERAR
ncbi:efflux RND transporter periplasmic adaptor subunit [Burkholderiaceae bacterium DAT-1]|nr:efflux RND transporter periplasmic adaptor subunit [Burkholderiaceae bacterium DAT-1]